jgi:hypothetical protein
MEPGTGGEMVETNFIHRQRTLALTLGGLTTIAKFRLIPRDEAAELALRLRRDIARIPARGRRQSAEAPFWGTISRRRRPCGRWSERHHYRDGLRRRPAADWTANKPRRRRNFAAHPPCAERLGGTCYSVRSAGPDGHVRRIDVGSRSGEGRQRPVPLDPTTKPGSPSRCQRWGGRSVLQR